MLIKQIKETCLYVKDLDKTHQFYHGLLNLPLISRVEGRHIFFRAGQSVLLCFISETTKKDEKLPPHYGTGKLHLAFEVEADVYESTKKGVQERGIEIIHEQTWKEGNKSFYFHDPDGHVLEIVQPGLWD